MGYLYHYQKNCKIITRRVVGNIVDQGDNKILVNLISIVIYYLDNT